MGPKTEEQIFLNFVHTFLLNFFPSSVNVISVAEVTQHYYPLCPCMWISQQNVVYSFPIMQHAQLKSTFSFRAYFATNEKWNDRLVRI
jgi:hypothetical protein